MYRTAVTGTGTAYALFNWYVLRPEVQLVLTCFSLANIFNAFLSVCISVHIFPVCTLNRLRILFLSDSSFSPSPSCLSPTITVAIDLFAKHTYSTAPKHLVDFLWKDRRKDFLAIICSFCPIPCLKKCCRSGMIIPNPDFFPSQILDTESRIRDLTNVLQKREGEKIFFLYFFWYYKFNKTVSCRIF